MQKLLLLGDSIRMGYERHVCTLLAPHYTVWAPTENGETSTHMLSQIAQWQIEQRPDVLHLNCGLHDLRFNPGESTPQVPLPEFKANLEQLFALLRSTGPDLRLIWATITPVMDSRHQVARSSRRYNADVIEYNSTARSIAERYGAKINDLYSFVTQNGLSSMLGADGVHYTHEGYKRLATKTAESISEY